jgi:hypothetical protein
MISLPQIILSVRNKLTFKFRLFSKREPILKNLSNKPLKMLKIKWTKFKIK